MKTQPARRLVVTFALVAGVLLALPAHAYLDPASGSMFLQLLLGGIAGVALFFKLTWHKIRGVFRRDSEQKPTEPSAK
ncbi:MAG: hypothetical protein KDD11_10945 [Acidobacteria bacterium]|nr:hypothetical protein [Acidobacteriota bacterium]